MLMLGMHFGDETRSALGSLIVIHFGFKLVGGVKKDGVVDVSRSIAMTQPADSRRCEVCCAEH